MKELSYKVNLGIVGKDKICNQILLDYIDRLSLKSNKASSFGEKMYIIEGISLKVAPYSAQDFRFFLEKANEIKSINILLYVLNIYSIDANIEKNLLDYLEFMDKFAFKGISALIGMDLNHILKKEQKNHNYYDEFTLIAESRKFNFIYCFKMTNPFLEIQEIFNILFKDIITKFKILNPELYEKAKASALDLSKTI